MKTIIDKIYQRADQNAIFELHTQCGKKQTTGSVEHLWHGVIHGKYFTAHCL